MKPIVYNNTTLRDGHQSLAATRMSTAQMLPIAPELDETGYGALETWGGATIDSCLRYLGENPFDRLRALKKAAPKTPQWMLLRGQNIVQYTPFPDDVVEAFVRCTAKGGLDIFRIFDALNDVRNVRTAVATVLSEKKHAQGAISYTISPVHTLEAYVQMAKDFDDLGVHSLCIKDMSGILTPPVAHELVKRIKKAVNLPLWLHSHCTAGLAPATYMAAIEAGVDCVDVADSPFANGSGQPDVLLMQAILGDGPRANKSLDQERIARIREPLQKVYGELDAFTSRTNERVDVEILRYQIPGGMLSNFVSQLKEQGMGDRLQEVLNEMPYVRKCLGWIPLVTPTSQIVGSQAMLNVKFGRWQIITETSVNVILGKYGKTPGPIDPELLETVIKKTGQKPIEGRPADELSPRMDSLRKELADKKLPTDDEACVLYAMFPKEFSDVAQGKAPAKPAAKAPAPSGKKVGETRRFRIKIAGQESEATVEEVA